MKYRAPLRTYVEIKDGNLLPSGARAFATYHCGAGGLNRNRALQVQQEDWRRIRPHL
jgi:hypothetical protein